MLKSIIKYFNYYRITLVLGLLLAFLFFLLSINIDGAAVLADTSEFPGTSLVLENLEGATVGAFSSWVPIFTMFITVLIMLMLSFEYRGHRKKQFDLTYIIVNITFGVFFIVRYMHSYTTYLGELPPDLANMFEQSHTYNVGMVWYGIFILLLGIEFLFQLYVYDRFDLLKKFARNNPSKSAIAYELTLDQKLDDLCAENAAKSVMTNFKVKTYKISSETIRTYTPDVKFARDILYTLDAENEIRLSNRKDIDFKPVNRKSKVYSLIREFLYNNMKDGQEISMISLSKAIIEIEKRI